VENVRRFVVGGVLVYAAVGIIKLLAGAGSGQQVQTVARSNASGRRQHG
jgi:hypothetical protein